MTTLRDYRRAKGLTLTDLSVIAGVTESQLSRIERFGKASPEVALKLEAWSERAVSAATLSPQVKVIRQAAA